MLNKSILIPVFFFAFTVLPAQQSVAQTWEFAPNTKDTINYVDIVGRKQGKWILFGKHKQNSCFSPTQKAEEGAYKENRKIGLWMEYYCNGNLKHKVTFSNGRPDGYAIMYYDNGKIQEEGQWKNNKWVGALKQYYENGQVQHEFNYNAQGKREGEQVYKYENGQVAVKGNFVNGKEAGVIKEFHENGDIKAEKVFNNGDVDVNSIKIYDPKKEFVKKNDAPVENAPKVSLKADEKAITASGSKAPIVLNGHHVLYNVSKQVTKDGEFKNNLFVTGKAYIYDDNGILQRIAIYKNGQYAGDGVVEK